MFDQEAHYSCCLVMGEKKKHLNFKNIRKKKIYIDLLWLNPRIEIIKGSWVVTSSLEWKGWEQGFTRKLLLHIDKSGQVVIGFFALEYSNPPPPHPPSHAK